MSKVFLQVPVNVAETKFNDMYFPFPEEPRIIVSQSAKQQTFCDGKETQKEACEASAQGAVLKGLHQSLGLQRQTAVIQELVQWSIYR